VKHTTNGCKVVKPAGKQYRLFVPSSFKHSQAVVNRLSNHFDYVFVSPKEACANLRPKACLKGIEITAIRERSSDEQEVMDDSVLLDLIAPVSRKDRPHIAESRDILH
jgi:hypothetical protein